MSEVQLPPTALAAPKADAEWVWVRAMRPPGQYLMAVRPRPGGRPELCLSSGPWLP